MKKIILIGLLIFLALAMPVHAYITASGHGYQFNLTNVSSEASGFFSASNFFNWINSSTPYTTQTCGVDVTNNSQTINVSSNVIDIRYSLHSKMSIVGGYEPIVLNMTIEQRNFTGSSWYVIEDYDHYNASGLCLARIVSVRNDSNFISNNKKQFRITLNVSQDPSSSCSGVPPLSCDGGYWGSSPYPNRALINFTFRTIVNITNCSDSGTPFLNFTGKNEETESVMNYSQDITLIIRNSTGSSDNKSFELRNQNNYSICIYPSWATYYADSISSYYATGYSTRYHYLNNATLTNSTQNISLYLLNSSDSTLITMRVLDEAENPEEDVSILIQRQYLGTGEFIQLTELKSDFDGYAYTYLKLHEVYKFYLVQNGVVVREYQPMQLETDSLEFRISTTEIPEYFSYYDKVVTSCSFSNSTNNLTCSYIDTSGLTMNMTLTVIRMGIAGDVEHCVNHSTSSSGTFVCGLTSNTSYRYSLTGTYYSDPTSYLWQSGWLNLSPEVVTFGAVGLLLSLFLIGILSFSAHWDVRVAIILTTFGMIFCVFIGLISFGVESMGMMLTIALLGGIVAYKIQT